MALGSDPPSGPACPCSGTLPPMNYVLWPLTRLPLTFCALTTTRAGSLPLVFVPLLAEGCDPTTAALFSPAEQAALAYATDVTAVGARVADATFASLRRHFSEREILELTVAIAAENMFNRLNAPLEIESQGFCACPLAGSTPLAGLVAPTLRE